jgi:glycosyltransferase involved in cell wall biosynthesis
MDLFAFPSYTDTFGNVILEALASAVPAVVTNSGGPKFLVEPGGTGYVAADAGEFISAVERILTDSTLHANMRQAATEYAAQQSWDAVFDSVFQVYAEAIELYAAAHPCRAALLSSRVHGRGCS